MQHWIISETHRRRKKILSDASHRRLQREALRGRRRKLRGRIADGALAMSDLLAAFAQAVREKN